MPKLDSPIRLVIAALTAAMMTHSFAAIPAVASASLCFSDKEMEDLLIVMAPVALRSLQSQCGAELPISALLRQSPSPLLQSLDIESEKAWPNVMPALFRIMGRDVSPAEKAAFEKMPREVFAAMMASKLDIRVNTKDCRSADAMLSLLQPLPPRNVAGVVIEIMHMKHREEKQKGTAGAMPVCERP